MKLYIDLSLAFFEVFKASGHLDLFISEIAFLALSQAPNCQEIFRKHGITQAALERVIDELREGEKVNSRNTEEERQALEKYTTDLTARAELGKLDPVVGRDREIRRTIQVLQRRTKNNPVLIGEPGVGKTAIAEGLALRIINDLSLIHI